MKLNLIDALAGRLPILPFHDLILDRLVVIALPPSQAFAHDVKRSGARDVLSLTPSGPSEFHRLPDLVRGRYAKVRSVYESNCRMAILHGRSAAAVMSRKAHAAISTFLIPKVLALTLGAPALFRHVRRGRLSVRGQTAVRLDGKVRTYLVVESHDPRIDNRRQYGTTGLAPLDIVRRLDGLNYVVLRWVEEIEAGRHAGDIDILLSAADAPRAAERFADRVGTYPLDIYSEDGSGGFTFNRVPYISPPMARQMLASAEKRTSGLRVPSIDWRYRSFAYHLLFHIKSRRVPPGTVSIGPSTFTSPKYYEELGRLAGLGGEGRPETFDGIEALLKRTGGFPGIDLIGFYSEKNPFLKHRYFDTVSCKPGLMTVFVRDFGRGTASVPGIRETLAKTFQILAEGAVSGERRAMIENNVRGGNWSDPEARGGMARPVYWFVCWDPRPAPPNARSRKKRPRVDNENVNLKYSIREALGEKVRKQQRLIHTSDNSAEALEHLEAIGDIDAALVAELRRRVLS